MMAATATGPIANTNTAAIDALPARASVPMVRRVLEKT